MEENSAQIWDKVPSVSHLMIRGKRIVYMPLCHAVESEPVIEGFVEDHTPDIDCPTHWLSRQPFR